MSDHYSVNFDEKDGWWVARCCCGWNDVEYTSGQDAVDALMYHAWVAATDEAVASMRDAIERPGA